MSTTYAQYRRTRRLSRLAWLLLATAATAVSLGLGWFFLAGQFLISGAPVAGPSSAPVLAAGWMRPVEALRPVPAGSARAALEALTVREPAGRDTYDRAAFGPAWLDVDGNGCDTRNDILRRDLPDADFADGSRCVVAAGTFQEPYGGRATAFRRGAATSMGVQIDHVVALGDAWAKGAQQLTARQRQHLANDPLNLIAVDGRANQDKGASDAARWLPANASIRCHYVARQISVKAAYRLWITPAEKGAMAAVLAGCAGQETVVPGRPPPAGPG